MLTQQMNELIEALYRDPPPLMMLVDPKSAGMWEAATKFQGRNHRRIKREMNKAWRKERQAEIKRPKPPMGIDRSIIPWWNDRASTKSPTSENT